MAGTLVEVIISTLSGLRSNLSNELLFISFISSLFDKFFLMQSLI